MILQIEVLGKLKTRLCCWKDCTNKKCFALKCLESESNLFNRFKLELLKMLIKKSQLGVNHLSKNIVREAQ